ncbi:hypothetical protein ACFY19_35700 [Streptosporangium saharense]|uniref:hypothetical protein n=1 Tax=Streptosporangium saharense TaxID=1706840 RepID=UPI003673E9D8
MSEYQYYEFVAIDRPLTAGQQAEVRALSTRARITATGFVNEYEWGDFKGSPRAMMERYYDAHLYLANWGTHRVMLRLPRTLLDPAVAGRHTVEDRVDSWTSGEHVILEMVSEEEEEDWEDDIEGSLSSIVGVRAELAAGDPRPLYLAWLSAGRDGEGSAPPVPPGLGSLTAAQRALADFLRVDDDLLTVAAEVGGAVHVDHTALATWIGGLPERRRNALLLRVATDEAAHVRAELLRDFHGRETVAERPVRTARELADAAAVRRKERLREERLRRERERVRRERQEELARERRLDELAGSPDEAWRRVESLVGTRKPREYGQAVELLRDLWALARREDDLGVFTGRLVLLRERHRGKSSLIRRLDEAGLPSA